jgi:hypothetical protein
MRSLYCISLPVTGWMTEFIIGVFVQCFSPNAHAQFAAPKSRKSRERFRGDNCCALAFTLGGDTRIVAGVTTLGGGCVSADKWVAVGLVSVILF